MKLELKVTNTFRRNWAATKRIVINRGGTRSGKTYSICQNAAVWLATSQVRANKQLKKGTWSIVRKFAATITRTVEKEFVDVCTNIFVEGKPLIDYIKINKTKKTYTFGSRVVAFVGADDPQKLRGYKSNILYCNEANELRFNQEFFQLIIRTSDEIYLDFNPSDEYVWINVELEQKRLHEKKDVEIIVSTYKDNTTLNKMQIDEIENLKNVDIELWKVYGLGQYGKVVGLVFDNWKVCEKIPKSLKWKIYGLDFGFTNDPTAVIEVSFLHGELWLREVLYEKRLTNSDISERLIECKVPKRSTIVADSAEPKSIEELRRKGWNIVAATKGADSINFGIDLIKQYQLNVTVDSVNLIKELRTYKYSAKLDSKGKRKPVDFANHLLDDLRYCLVHQLTQPNQKALSKSF